MTAQFIHTTKVSPLSPNDNDGFNAMGKPVPFYRRQAGYEHARQMGLTSDAAFAAVSSMSLFIERDKPYEAMEAASHYLDLTGNYRLLAVLLTATP